MLQWFFPEFKEKLKYRVTYKVFRLKECKFVLPRLFDQPCLLIFSCLNRFSKHPKLYSFLFSIVVLFKTKIQRFHISQLLETLNYERQLELPGQEREVRNIQRPVNGGCHSAEYIYIYIYRFVCLSLRPVNVLCRGILEIGAKSECERNMQRNYRKYDKTGFN